MGTRGLYGFRMNGVEKFTYNHFDSYPDGLGAEVANFCESTPLQQMKDIFNRIIMVTENDKPTPEQIKACESFTNTSVGRQSTQDWYCLLRELQGNLCKLKEIPGDIFMIDNHDFIKDSLFCEYAYIIDLDNEVLEYWIGFQRKPWEENPYGTDAEDGYYPCRKYAEFNLGEDAEHVVDQMNRIASHQDAYEYDKDICDLITDAAESVGWTARVWEDGNYNVTFSNSSPEGEDLEYEFMFDDIEDLYQKVYDEYSDFDCDEHVYDLLTGYGRSGLPCCIRDLCDDAEEIESMLQELADAIKKLI